MIKVLANRKKAQLDDVVVEGQYEFIKGRNISKGILLANE